MVSTHLCYCFGIEVEQICLLLALVDRLQVPLMHMQFWALLVQVPLDEMLLIEMLLVQVLLVDRVEVVLVALENRV